MENESVTISLERYEELLAIKEKYENDTRSKLASEIETVNARCEQIEYDNKYMAKYLKEKMVGFANRQLRDFRDEIFLNINCFGFISSRRFKTIYDKIRNGISIDKIELIEEWPHKDKYDIPLYKNETVDVSNSDFVTLHRNMDKLVYEFMRTHDIQDGAILTYSIDNLQDLKNSGTPCGACDGYLGIRDFSNNEIIASI